ncbi:MAG TPA: DUF805 domain-containing protein [Candidatus Competibacter sp.]|nr:DUF805 domain-containing protein [Candidatus Competibacter sp.]HRX62663.1 DUF805 domain-containing protein [Candidatus Competibacter sp.]
MAIIAYLFSFRGQMGRLEFLGHFILVAFIILVALGVGKASGLSDQQVDALLVPVSLAALYLFLSAAVRRRRDLGIHLAWLLALLIPWVNYGMLLMFMFAAGWAKKSGISSLLAIQKLLAESDGGVNSREAATFEDLWKTEMGEKILALRGFLWSRTLICTIYMY